MIAAINELGADQTKLDQETWRLNELTRSKECIWSRLISILKLNQTESIRHSLYNKWRRNRQKIQRDLFENHLDSFEISDKLDKESKDRHFSSNNSQTSDMFISHRETRSTVQGQSESLTLIEASFIFTSKEWKEKWNPIG